MKYEIQININTQERKSCIKVSNKYQNFWKLLDRVLKIFLQREERIKVCARSQIKVDRPHFLYTFATLGANCQCQCQPMPREHRVSSCAPKVYCGILCLAMLPEAIPRPHVRIFGEVQEEQNRLARRVRVFRALSPFCIPPRTQLLTVCQDDTCCQH